MGHVIGDADVSLLGVAAAPRRVRLSTLAGLGDAVSVRSISTRRWRAGLMATDVLAGLGGIIAAVVGRFGVDEPLGPSGPYVALVAAGPPVWLALLTMAGVYDEHRIGAGASEFGRIANAALWSLGVIVAASYVSRAEVSRAVTAVAVLAVALLTIGVHLAGRLLLRLRIRAGGAIHRAVVIGPAADVRSLADHVRRVPHSGLRVVGAYFGESERALAEGPPDASSTPAAQIIEAARRACADTIAVAGSGLLSGTELRRLSWDLEGTGIRLLVAPGTTELAGPRLLVQPVGGLPLVHVRETDFSGPTWILKSALDRAGALLLGAVLSPLLIGIALAVRLGSPGAVIFRQSRVGRHGREFRMLKFRTMRDGAEADLAGLRTRSDHDGVLFKMRGDPRVTAVGRFLRRYSLDELPQLLNVAAGSMSLVGPRPPLRSEVDRYPADLLRRRLLVKPGMTGLWQVSGRSDLSWEETVRLDLQYIESWSVMLDGLVLWKTLRAVVSGRGAY